VSAQSFVRKLQVARSVLFGVFLLNFIAFVVGTLYLGGDAINGRVEDGHYYLWGKDRHGHGEFTEVNEEVFRYSRWHAYSLVATCLACFGAAAGEGLAKKRIPTIKLGP
jgi:hypothetical protein